MINIEIVSTLKQAGKQINLTHIDSKQDNFEK